MPESADHRGRNIDPRRVVGSVGGGLTLSRITANFLGVHPPFFTTTVKKQTLFQFKKTLTIPLRISIIKKQTTKFAETKPRRSK